MQLTMPMGKFQMLLTTVSQTQRAPDITAHVSKGLGATSPSGSLGCKYAVMSKVIEPTPKQTKKTTFFKLS